MITLFKVGQFCLEEQIKEFFKNVSFNTTLSYNEYRQYLVVVKNREDKCLDVQISDCVFLKYFQRVPKYIKLIPHEYGRVIITRFNYKDEICSEIGVPSKNWAKKYALISDWEKRILIK